MSIAPHDHGITAGNRRALIGNCEVHIAREQFSRCASGALARGNASFSGRLGRGSDVRPGTADSMPACMNPELIGRRSLQEVEAYLEATGIGPRRFGGRAMSGPGFVLRLGRGRSPAPGAVDRVGARMAENASAAEREAVHASVEDSAMAVPVDAEGQEERQMNETTGYITTAQAAAYLGLSPRTLESYRCRGGGPPYYDLGGVVRYLLSDLVKWASARRRRSTSDDGRRSPAPKDGDGTNDGEDEDDGADGPGEVR